MAVALDTALARLEVDERQLLELKYLHGADVRSLAERLCTTPKAIESRLTRARAELRRLLLQALQSDET